MKRVAVLTSGGDAPGMNAAIRAVVRRGISLGYEIFGVRQGFQGLMAGDYLPLGARAVGGIIQRGGTILGSARAPEFQTEAGQLRALDQLARHRIEGLIVIGGNGSQAGAHALMQLGFPVVGVASTIDNDLYGADITIGVDTALNIALEAVDRLKTTASSHRRAFIVEVMGRNCGYLGLVTAIAGGAEAVALPEVLREPDYFAAKVQAAHARGQENAIIVVAEGAACNAICLGDHFKQHRDRLGFGVRVTILGHVQRGGSPGAFDRLLATRTGAGAIERLAAGESGILVSLARSTITTTPLTEVVNNTKTLDLTLLDLAEALAT